MNATLPPPRPWAPIVTALALAWLAATAWGTVVQTQFNLQALAGLGVEVPPGVRVLTTLQDLAGFAPLYAGIVAAAWLPALALAAWLARRWPAARVPLFAVAGGLGVLAAVRCIDALAPMPVFIDATRHTVGLLSMVAGSVAAAGWYAYRTRQRSIG